MVVVAVFVDVIVWVRDLEDVSLFDSVLDEVIVRLGVIVFEIILVT